MAKSTLTVKVHIDGVRETLAAFRALPKDATTELRAASLRLAELVAAKAQVAALVDSPQAALLAPTVKAVRDRVPAVQVGGSRRVGRNRVPAWQVLFVAEFGMHKRSGWYSKSRYRDSRAKQSRPHQGTEGYWFFPTVEAETPMINREWNAASDRVLRAFGAGDR